MSRDSKEACDLMDNAIDGNQSSIDLVSMKLNETILRLNRWSDNYDAEGSPEAARLMGILADFTAMFTVFAEYHLDIAQATRKEESDG